jgi:hypothetical protein
MRRRDVLAFGASALAACTTTKVDSIDLRETKLLVLALGANSAHRTRFEEALAARLDAGGIRAVASHPLLPRLDGATRDDVIRIARANEVTSVVAIAAMTVNAANELEPLGPAPADAGGRLGAFVDAAVARGEIAAGAVVFVTRVYRLATDELVWGGVSWQVDADDVDAVITETTTVIADNILSAERQLLELRDRGIGNG